jgi:hypothetical protein
VDPKEFVKKQSVQSTFAAIKQKPSVLDRAD